MRRYILAAVLLAASLIGMPVAAWADHMSGRYAGTGEAEGTFLDVRQSGRSVYATISGADQGTLQGQSDGGDTAYGTVNVSGSPPAQFRWTWSPDGLDIELTRAGGTDRAIFVPAGAAGSAGAPGPAGGGQPGAGNVLGGPQAPPPGGPPPSPPGASADEYFASVAGAPVGPLTLADLIARIEAGEVGAGDLVWRVGSPEWAPAETFAELAEALSGNVEYFVERNGAQEGPLSLEEVAALVESGDLRAESLVWTQGMSAWTPAGEVAELDAAFEARAAAVPPPLPPREPGSDGPPPLPGAAEDGPPPLPGGDEASEDAGDPPPLPPESGSGADAATEADGAADGETDAAPEEGAPASDDPAAPGDAEGALPPPLPETGEAGDPAANAEEQPAPAEAADEGASLETPSEPESMTVPIEADFEAADGYPDFYGRLAEDLGGTLDEGRLRIDSDREMGAGGISVFGLTEGTKAVYASVTASFGDDANEDGKLWGPGLVIRDSGEGADRSFYVLLLSPEGYRVAAFVGGGTPQSVSGSLPDGVSAEGPVRLAARESGGGAEFFVDGVQVASLSVSSISGSDVGLVAFGPGEFTFDDFGLNGAADIGE